MQNLSQLKLLIKNYHSAPFHSVIHPLCSMHACNHLSPHAFPPSWQKNSFHGKKRRREWGYTVVQKERRKKRIPTSSSPFSHSKVKGNLLFPSRHRPCYTSLTSHALGKGHIPRPHGKKIRYSFTRKQQGQCRCHIDTGQAQRSSSPTTSLAEKMDGDEGASLLSKHEVLSLSSSCKKQVRTPTPTLCMRNKSSPPSCSRTYGTGHHRVF